MMTTIDPDDDALLRLIAAGGRAQARRGLLDGHRGPAAALAAGPGAWRAAGLSAAQVTALRAPDEALIERGQRWLAQPGHHLLGWHDPDYPPLLRRAPHPPLALFVAGDPALLWRPAIAVVGSRSPTPAGRDNAAGFARELAGDGWAVASGLAAGVDTAAHCAALDAGGTTIAVLGTGPDQVYPLANSRLHARIADQGALVSEHLPGTGPRKEHFPSRNRILAGLSLATLVVEAAQRSGALITARLAAEAGREVFAVPGSIHNPRARGCHRLIRDGAGLVESAAEVIAALAPLAAELADALRERLDAPTSVDRAGDRSAGQVSGEGRLHEPDRGQIAGNARTPDADPDYQTLWKALGHDPTSMDQLVERSGLTAAALSSMLLLMELDGRVAVQHGRYFRNG